MPTQITPTTFNINGFIDIVEAIPNRSGILTL